MMRFEGSTFKMLETCTVQLFSGKRFSGTVIEVNDSVLVLGKPRRSGLEVARGDGRVGVTGHERIGIASVLTERGP